MDFSKKIRLFLLTFVIILTCCKKDDEQEDFWTTPFVPNPIFPNTERIYAPSIIYVLDGIVYRTLGDDASIDVPDTFPSTPSFGWHATGKSLVMVAVFDSRISVAQNSILNKDDIVWIWHSGLYTGNEGSIRFSDGVSLSNMIQLEDTIVPLKENYLYTWAIWAWDNNGEMVEQSSRELAFIVKNKHSNYSNN